MTNLATKINSKPLARSLALKREAINEEARTVELAFSSEQPVSRWFGEEILDHAPSSVRLGRLEQGGAVLVGHDSSDHVGVVERVWIDSDRKGRVLVRFGKGARATEIFDDIKDGIRRHVSVGYQILEAFVEKRGEDGEPDTVRVTDWEPFEVSIVSIPADASVGVGRSKEPDDEQTQKTDPLNAGFFMPEEKERAMTDTATTTENTAPKDAVDVQVVSNEAAQNERSRITKINTIGERFGKQELAREFIEKGKTVDDFRSAVMDKLEPQAETTSVAQLDLTDKEVREYSVMRAIRAAVTGDWKGAGFERECSIAIADKLGREAQGFFVPYNVQTRTNNVGTATAGGHLVGTDHLAGSFIDNLRAQTLLGRLGATFLTGLVGNVDIPRKDGSAAFYWLAEDADVTDSDLTLGNVALTPKTVAGSTPMTRRLLKQSAPSIDALVMADLMRGSALAIDKAGFVGSGAAGQPTGIVNQSNVNTQTVTAAGAPTWNELVGFETAVDTDDALEGSLAYVTTPTVKGNLKVTKKDAGSGIFLMEGGEANGYPVYGNSQITANEIIFGNFADVIIGMWGVLDIMPDTAAKAASGGLVLRAFQDVDVAVRHPESFCITGA